MTAPETGYGYLKRGDALGEDCFRTAQFVEKPDPERAKAFLSEGGYAWNGGIFAFRVSTFLAELEAHRPGVIGPVREAVAAGRGEDGARFHPDGEAFARAEAISVDYAVMEPTAHAAMVPASMAWSDIGSGYSLHAARDRNDLGNAVRGRAELVDCHNVLVESDGPRVSVIGLDNVVVVVDGDEVLVTTMEGAQKVGKLGGAANQRASSCLSGRSPSRGAGRFCPRRLSHLRANASAKCGSSRRPDCRSFSSSTSSPARRCRSRSIRPTRNFPATARRNVGHCRGPAARQARHRLSREAGRQTNPSGCARRFYSELLQWHPLGDFFYIPANTVHAIGAGVSLIEVQQNSDVTYRLYVLWPPARTAP